MQRDMPKALIPLHSGDTMERFTFIDRHIAVLGESGVDHFVLVVNQFNAAQFKHLESSRVSTIVNGSDVATTGSSLSLSYGLHAVHLRAPEVFPNIIVLDGDIIFERRLARLVVDHDACSALFVTPNISDDSEEVRVYLREGEPVLIGKGITTSMADGLTLAGESLGIIKLVSRDLPMLLNLTTWLAGCPSDSTAFGYSKQRSEHEEVWQYLFNLDRLAVSAVPPDIIYSECDSVEDLALIQESVIPGIIYNDKRWREETC